MGFMKPKMPEVDKSGLAAAQEQKRKADEAAAAAEARKQAIEAEGAKRKKNVTASGREATILAGSDEDKDKLGN